VTLARSKAWLRERLRRGRLLHRLYATEIRLLGLLNQTFGCDDCGGVFMRRPQFEHVIGDKQFCKFCVQRHREKLVLKRKKAV